MNQPTGKAAQAHGEEPKVWRLLAALHKVRESPGESLSYPSIWCEPWPSLPEESWPP